MMVNLLKPFKKFNKIIDSYAGILLLIISIMVTLNILGRVTIQKPIYGAYEYVSFAMLFVIVLSLANCSLQGGHTNVTLLLERFSIKNRNLVEILTGIFTFINLFIIILSLFKFMQYKTLTGEATLLTKIPMNIIVAVALLGFVLLSLSVIAKMVEVNKKETFK